MKRMIVSLFAVALVVALAIPAMAANLTTQSVNGVTTVYLDGEAIWSGTGKVVAKAVNGVVTVTEDGVQVYPARITVNFPGVKDVTVTGYADGWFTLDGTFNDSCAFDMPRGYVSSGYDAILVSTGGMSWQLNYQTLDVTQEIDIPVITLRVFGINADARLSVYQQGGNYFDEYLKPVQGGAQQCYNVFGDEDSVYSAELTADGYQDFAYTSMTASCSPNVYDGETELWIYFGAPFYSVNVPNDVTDVYISEAGWIVYGTNDSQILLFGNGQTAELKFNYNGKTYETTFPLDGSNPFTTTNFASLEAFVKLVRYYTGDGSFYDLTDSIMGSTPDFNLTVYGGTANISSAALRTQAVQVKLTDALPFWTGTYYIANVNNQGTVGTKSPMKETSPGSGIWQPTTLVNYSWNSSLIFVPTYQLLIYADDEVIGSLTVTVHHDTMLTKIVKLQKNVAGVFEEIQSMVEGTAGDFTLVHKGGVNISGTNISGKPLVVRIEGVKAGQVVQVAPVNNLGTEGAKVNMQVSGGVPGNYETVAWNNFSWNGNLNVNLYYALKFYVDGELVGTLNVTITP